MVDHDLSSSKPCIYKAPDHIRKVNEECYRPYVISIGPLYHGKLGGGSLEAMQDCKLRCLKLFLEHPSNSHNEQHYLSCLKDWELEVRDCYVESIILPSDKFNAMMLADSVFIICLFMKHLPDKASSIDLFHMYRRNLLKWEYKLIRDLFLEENQIPFFVLERLFQKAFGAAYPNTSFLDLACKFIKGSKIPVVYKHVIDADAETEVDFTKVVKIPIVEKHMVDAGHAETIQRIKDSEKEIKHLVDLLREFCFPPTLSSSSPAKIQLPSSVSNLKAAKVKFVASKSTNLLDVTFSKGVLQIPPFELWDVSESYFRSIILFERSHLPISKTSFLHHYIFLLENLIRTPEDVQILVQSGIIRNWIGNEETIARLFNGGITRHIPLLANFCYSDVCQDLNDFANTRWNQYRAILKRDYFSHPWAAMSLIYALILLLLSLLQTIGTFTKK